MPVFVVSYDLTRPGQHYPQLWETLKGLSGKRLLESAWAVHANGPAEALREYVWTNGAMDPTDRLLVMARDSDDWAAKNLRTKLGEF
jgi:hypothetical protein